MTAARNARLLLAGDGLSAFGTWIDFLAILTLAAYQFQVTPYEMALVSAAGVLPGILAAPLIGRLCDQRDPKRILLLSIVLRVAATGAILLGQGFAPFVALVALRSVFASVALPAINVMAVRSVAADDRARFFSLLNVLNSAAKILAPAIGTVSSSLASEAYALVLSLSFSSASFAAFAFVTLAARPASAPTGTSPTAAPAAAAPSLLPLLWIIATYAFAVFMVNNLMPLVLQQTGFDKSLLGLLVSCSGAGNILSGLWLARTSLAPPLQGTLGEMMWPASMQAMGFAAVGFALWAQGANAAGVLTAIFFVGGTFSARFAIASNVYLSRHHAASIGRASGTLQAWQNAMILVAPLLGAAVLEAWGGPALFGFAVAAATLSCLLFIALQAAGVPRFKVLE